jgi:hypothetical protein
MAKVETNGVPSENEGSDAPEFLKRLSALPYVESTWQRLAAAYETYGKANPHLCKTLDSVESMLASNATPLLKRHKDTSTFLQEGCGDTETEKRGKKEREGEERRR